MAYFTDDNYCWDCDRDFATYAGLRQHWIQSSNHSFCRECNTHFVDEVNLEGHYLNDHHYCGRCRRLFQSEHGLHEHNRQSHVYCAVCRRVFNSENNLRQHMNSSVHRPKDVPCAFQHLGCMDRFVSKSAMILHLEAGRCLSGADRGMIDRWVRLNDRQNVITVPRRLLTNGDDAPRYLTTERSWNGRAYECVLCHKGFPTLDALNRHLASPRHQERIYRCPLSTCGANFNTLSGLCQHVESESCGILRFRIVREGMDRLLDNMNRLRIT